MINKTSRIFIAGHRGLVGSAILRALTRDGYHNIVLRTHSELDLLNQSAVRRFFEQERPQFVFLAAARVGGIYANNTYPAEFIYSNLQIQINVLESARRSGVERLLFLGSSCIYPKFTPQPIREESIFSGELEPTNRPYAVAKLAGVEMCWAYNRQYHTQYLATMPTNLYGEGDNYDLETSHVIPALIRKMHDAKANGRSEVMLWGSGTPRREFLYSDDLAEACVFLMGLAEPAYNALVSSETAPPLVNIGCGQDQTIRELATTIAEIVGFKGIVCFNPEMPDGTPRKLLDVSRLTSLGWRPRTALRDGLAAAYSEFLAIHTATKVRTAA